MGQFFETFPEVQTILELGSLEGGHSFLLAERDGVSITAVEGRAYNVEKATFIQKSIRTKSVRFVIADLEKQPLLSLGQFDAIFCLGLLYHLPRPWELIDQLREVSPRVFIWTHYAPEDKATEFVNEFPGMWYEEGGIEDPLSGLSPKSFWLPLPALKDRLRKNGFEHIKVIENLEMHPNGKGPCVTLAAAVEPF